MKADPTTTAMTIGMALSVAVLTLGVARCTVKQEMLVTERMKTCVAAGGSWMNGNCIAPGVAYERKTG